MQECKLLRIRVLICMSKTKDKIQRPEIKKGWPPNSACHLLFKKKVSVRARGRVSVSGRENTTPTVEKAL